MSSFNGVTFMGNLTRDPETTFLKNDKTVTEFGLAMNRKYKTGDETREEVCFIDVKFWGKRGETISEYFKKGSPILVNGSLKQDSWEDKETGAKRSKHLVSGKEFAFVGKKETADVPF
tara:strand:- start:343 stop:696 length:354 start_codon:yes stop_codon:yes gene_type:complete